MEKAGIKFKPGEHAAHIVPKGICSRAPKVQLSINQARGVLNKHGLLDAAANGFKTRSANHLGTHSDKFLIQIGDIIQNADKAGGKAGVIKELRRLEGRIRMGAFI